MERHLNGDSSIESKPLLISKSMKVLPKMSKKDVETKLISPIGEVEDP